MNLLMKKILSFFLVLVLFSSPAWAKDHFNKILKKWTRDSQTYRSEDLKATLIWKATYLTPEMVEALISREAQAYDLSANQTEKIRQYWEEKIKGDAVYFITFYTHDRKFNDITQERGHWDVRLKKGDQVSTPLSIEKIDKPTPLDRLHFPYWDIWSRGYFVRFPSDSNGGLASQELQIFGPEVKGSLVWSR